MTDLSNQVPVTTMAQVEQLERDYPGDMVAGYFDGVHGKPWPSRDPSPAYEHGRRNGMNDRNHTSDPEQHAIIRDGLRAGNDAADRIAKQRGYRTNPRLSKPGDPS